MNRQYSGFAAAYDQMMHDVDRDRWISYLDSFLREAEAKEILECACGTGVNTIRLHRLGYRVIASDASAEMLSEAENNAVAAGAKDIRFVCQDMRKLCVHKPVDAIVCVCDGVNYLTSAKDVRSFFIRAHESLKPGGLLLFDVSSAYKFRHILGTNVFTEETDAYAYIWKNNYDPKTKLCEMSLTGFVKSGEQYDRFTETHLQRAHSEGDLVRALSQAGFSEIRTFDAFTREPVKTDSSRIQFAAIRGE